jgi:hypothetical protein
MPTPASLYRRLSLAIARANPQPTFTSYMPLRNTRPTEPTPPALAADGGQSTTDDGSSTDGATPTQAYVDRDDDLKKDALGVRTEEVEPLVGRENLCASSNRSRPSQPKRWRGLGGCTAGLLLIRLAFLALSAIQRAPCRRTSISGATTRYVDRLVCSDGPDGGGRLHAPRDSRQPAHLLRISPC